MTKEELKAYNEALIARYSALFNITIEGYFKIEDLKEWLYSVARNNDDMCDTILNIVDRLPGFVQYVKDKKAGVL